MSTSAAQAVAFFREARTNQRVWGIRDQDGFPAPLNRDGLRAMPFWSMKSRAENVIATVPAYSTMEPVEIALSEFRERWLPGLKDDGLHVGVNWSGGAATGYDMAPSEVEARLATP
ncbi:DUF2750 domain-containing protein [Kribbella sp. NPDC050124]|uniref:DUF2750 domain-containing protein n=1 Tax=Kribbella sp. NPDC050124 TaxID=3364114 RepID=UPI0037AC291B